MRYYETTCEEAKRYAREYTVNQEKEKAFLDGVLWTVRKLEQMVAEDRLEDMMDASAKTYMNKIKVSDVRKFCSAIKVFEKKESETL